MGRYRASRIRRLSAGRYRGDAKDAGRASCRRQGRLRSPSTSGDSSTAGPAELHVEKVELAVSAAEIVAAQIFLEPDIERAELGVTWIGCVWPPMWSRAWSAVQACLL